MPKKKVKKDLSNLLIAGTSEIDVPKHMLFYTKTGQEKEINTLTKTGKIAIRNKKPVIKFENTSPDVNYLIIKKGGTTKEKIKEEHNLNINFAANTAISNKIKNLKEKIKTTNKRTKEGRNLINEYENEIEALTNVRFGTSGKINSSRYKLENINYKLDYH